MRLINKLEMQTPVARYGGGLQVSASLLLEGCYPLLTLNATATVEYAGTLMVATYPPMTADRESTLVAI